MTLTKANVSLFASFCDDSETTSSSPSPSLTWWPRLAAAKKVKDGDGDGDGDENDDDDDETAVAWDDYEKDYSDLPSSAAERVSACEAALRLGEEEPGSAGGSGGSVGSGSVAVVDRCLRRSLACADDSRRRHRAQRLREMRREVISRGEEAGRRRKEEKEESL